MNAGLLSSEGCPVNSLIWVTSSEFAISWVRSFRRSLSKYTAWGATKVRSTLAKNATSRMPIVATVIRGTRDLGLPPYAGAVWLPLFADGRDTSTDGLVIFR